jgi:MFS transporter, SP family, major inositol transporter
VLRFVVLAAVVAAIGGSLAGYDTGVVAGAMLFIRPAFGLSTGLVELVVGAALIGATIGVIASARLTDTLGRRAVLLAAAVCFAAGAIGSALAANMPSLVAADIESIVVTRTGGWPELLAPTLRIGLLVGIGLAILNT